VRRQLVSSTAGAALCDSFALLTSLMMVTIIAMIVFSAAVSQRAHTRSPPPARRRPPAATQPPPPAPRHPPVAITLAPFREVRRAHTLRTRHAPRAAMRVRTVCAVEPGTDLTNWPSDKNSWFLSTPRTYWWSLVTLTGVGYGDEYPRKLPGRVLAIMCAIVGIIVVAVPIEVIGRYFGQHYKRCAPLRCATAVAPSPLCPAWPAVRSHQPVGRSPWRLASSEAPLVTSPSPAAIEGGALPPRAACRVPRRSRVRTRRVVGAFVRGCSHVYSREVAKECEVDGVLQFRPLYEKLVKLSSQGLLRVRCPRDEREVEAVVAAYDGKGNCRLESDEWSALIEDLVAHRGDWEGCALRRTVDYLAEARDGVRELHREVDELRKRRTKQHDELCALVRERFPHGVPKGGVRGARAKEAG
jgi:hypothetical protein